MAGQPVQIGPFLGGLNTYSDPTAVSDNQVVKAENFELDLDGSLKNRPPIVERSVDFPLGATGNMQILGYYYAAQNVPYLLASDGLSSTYYLSGDAWVLVTDTIAASAMTQFDAKAWLLAPEGSANPGGYWTPLDGFVADANMPKGECIVAHKFRLWVAVGKNAASNATRLLFSDILGQPTLWPVTPEFIDVGAGDGQAIVQLTTYYQALLLFRTNSVYSFTYNSDPASGTVNEVVPGVGLENKDCLVAFEDYLYFFYKGRAYEFINNRANQINVQVPFDATSQAGIYKAYTVTRYNRRIMFGYYNTIFAFNLANRTWSTWVSTQHGAIGQFFESPSSSSDVISAVTHSSLAVPPGASRSTPTLFTTDALTEDAEPMQCSVVTKNFDYQAPGQYKKLSYWGISAVFKGQATATVHPISIRRTITWDMLLSTDWASELEFNWDQPLSGSFDIVSTVESSGSSTRKFIKLDQALRFRQVNFQAVFDTDGSSSSAPVRLFSMTTYVVAKEHVSKQTS